MRACGFVLCCLRDFLMRNNIFDLFSSCLRTNNARERSKATINRKDPYVSTNSPLICVYLQNGDDTETKRICGEQPCPPKRV